MKDNLPKIGPEPKKTNRFVVELVGTDVQPWTVCKADRPSYTLNEGWDDMDIELIDIIGPSTAQAVYDGIIEKGLMNREVIMRLLDPVGAEVEKWEILGDYKKIDFDSGDYAVDEVIKIKLTFKIDSCKLS